LKYEVHLYTKETHDKWGGYPNGFPENSYEYDRPVEVTDCIISLLKNKISGIYITEIIQHDSE
jgi:hypothetical protein